MRCLHIALSLFVLANVNAGPAALAQAPGSARPILGMTTEDWSFEIVTDELSYPWDINRAGNLIVMTEAGGHIVMIEDGRLNRYAVNTSDPIVHDGGSGLLGMTLSEDFQTSGLAYLYHSYRSGSRLNLTTGNSLSS
jgi:glucose/arabinose dehydrogenase